MIDEGFKRKLSLAVRDLTLNMEDIQAQFYQAVDYYRYQYRLMMKTATMIYSAKT